MRRLLIITLASLAGLGGVAFAAHVIRAAGKGRMTLTVTPQRQSVVRGSTASFSVGVARSASSAGATALRVTGLPHGVRAHWQLANGRYVHALAPTETGAVLILITSAGTRMGTRHMRIRATHGATTRTRPLTLSVLGRRSPTFSLKVAPRRQVMPRGATATFGVTVVRGGALRSGRLALRVLGMPRGARAALTQRTLEVRSATGQRLGSERIVIEASSRVGATVIRRFAVVVVTLVRARPFIVGGDLATPLLPGRDSPLDLILTNRHRFDIRVVDLNVRVRALTTKRSCRGDVNYAATQYRGRYPLLLHPGSTQLSALVASSSLWPHVSMHDLPVNQDACRRAVVSLEYRGLATR